MKATLEPNFKVTIYELEVKQKSFEVISTELDTDNVW